MKSLFLWAIGMLGLIGLSVYETVFSPSFMMQFVTAGLILCALSELLWFGRLRILWLRDVLFLIGMGLAFAAVVMYVTGDDRMTLDVLGGAALSALLLCLWIYRTRKRGTGLDVLAYAAAWAGFLVCSFTILCGFTNTFLFFYGATLLLLQGIRLFHDLKSADRHTASDGIKRNLVQAIILAGVLVLIVAEFHNPFTSKPVAWFIRTFGRGPEILYENEGKNMTEEDTAFLPGAGWLDTDGNSIQAHGGQIVRMPVPDGNEKKERYVWTGENKTNGHLGNSVAVYVSDDLHQWEYKGDVLRTIESREALDEDPYFSELYRNCSEAEKDNIYACINTNAVLERPKMLYNEATETYVIWFHSDDATEKNSYKYDVGMAGVAVSDSPFGPFRFLRRQRLSECRIG